MSATAMRTRPPPRCRAVHNRAKKARRLLLLIFLIARIWLIALFAALRRGRGFQELDVEDQILVGRNGKATVGRATHAIAQVGWDHDLPVVALTHQLHRL